MGLEQSRASIVDLERATKNRTIEFWKQAGYNNYAFPDQTTLQKPTLEKAGKYIGEFFKDMGALEILEVCAGSGLASKIITYELCAQKIVYNIVKTDIGSFDTPNDTIIPNLPSHVAVRKYGTDKNILLIISPPPNCYVDYYAIKEFELQDGLADKYVIFIGELGASDGGDGMYHYMMHTSCWKIVCRQMLYVSLDCYGGNCEKELFIFQKIK